MTTPVMGSIATGDDNDLSDADNDIGMDRDFGLDRLIISPGVDGRGVPSRSSVISSVPSCMYNPRREDRCLRLCGVTGTSSA